MSNATAPDREWLAAIQASDGTVPEAYLSWSDDGVTLVCEREECMRPGPCSSGMCWFQIELPFRLTPEMALAARDAHIASHS